MQHGRLYLAAGAILLSSGCAPKIVLEAGHEGALPRAASLAVMADEPIPRDLEDALKAGLVDQKFVLSDRPAYLARLSFAQLQGKVGVVTSDGTRSTWALAPARSRSKRTSRATVVVFDANSGREVLRAHANERARGVQENVARRLGNALVQQIREGSSSP
jgi:hypothetical protein